MIREWIKPCVPYSGKCYVDGDANKATKSFIGELVKSISVYQGFVKNPTKVVPVLQNWVNHEGKLKPEELMVIADFFPSFFDLYLSQTADHLFPLFQGKVMDLGFMALCVCD